MYKITNIRRNLLVLNLENDKRSKRPYTVIRVLPYGIAEITENDFNRNESRLKSLEESNFIRIRPIKKAVPKKEVKEKIKGGKE